MLGFGVLGLVVRCLLVDLCFVGYLAWMVLVGCRFGICGFIMWLIL